MGFVVDKVSEDSFYENLLLGMSKILEKSPCVGDLKLQRAAGLRQIDIRNWEHHNGIILPEDLRAFYSSSNGFLYSYKFSYDFQANKNESERFFRVGMIQVYPLEMVAKYEGFLLSETSFISSKSDRKTIGLSLESRVFVLHDVESFGYVVLVYVNNYATPSIWLVNKNTKELYFLAEDFTTYLKMCVAHLAVPNWQCVVSKEGLPEWSKEIFQIIAPGILNEDKNLIESNKFRVDTHNKLDPAIFFVGNQVQEEVSSTTKNPEKKPAKNLARKGRK